MYSIHNEGKSVVALIRPLKIKIYKFMTSISKNALIHTVQQLRWNQLMLKIMHILTLVKNDIDSKFEVSDHVRISKYKSIFAKG